MVRGLGLWALGLGVGEEGLGRKQEDWVGAQAYGDGTWRLKDQFDTWTDTLALWNKTGFFVFNIRILGLEWWFWYFKNGFDIFIVLGLGMGLGSRRSLKVPLIRFIV